MGRDDSYAPEAMPGKPTPVFWILLISAIVLAVLAGVISTGVIAGLAFLGAVMCIVAIAAGALRMGGPSPLRQRMRARGLDPRHPAGIERRLSEHLGEPAGEPRDPFGRGA